MVLMVGGLILKEEKVKMKIVRGTRSVSDIILQGLRKRGEMTLTEAAGVLGCSPAQVHDSLLKLVKSTRDPYRYKIIHSETWKEHDHTVQVLVEPTRQTKLRRKMMRLPEFKQVARLPLGWFTLGQAARALKKPRRETLQLLDHYEETGYVTRYRLLLPRGKRETRWQRIW
jgi:hypothetical protein